MKKDGQGGGRGDIGGEVGVGGEAGYWKEGFDGKFPANGPWLSLIWRKPPPTLENKPHHFKTQQRIIYLLSFLNKFINKFEDFFRSCQL